MFKIKRKTYKLSGYAKLGYKAVWELEETFIYLVLFNIFYFPIRHYYKIPYYSLIPGIDMGYPLVATPGPIRYLPKHILITKELPTGVVIER